MSKKILVTGSAGFIGSNFVRIILDKTDYEIVSFDALTYAGNLENLAPYKDNDSHIFVKGNIESKSDLKKIFSNHTLIHLLLLFHLLHYLITIKLMMVLYLKYYYFVLLK